MVCRRCILAVEEILSRLEIPFHQVQLGEIHLEKEINERQKEKLSDALNHIGFEIIDNHQSKMIEKIKQLVIKKARLEIDDKEKKINLSIYLAERLHYEYTYLSSVFSEVEGRTIENFYIEQKIEKAKELLVYGDMNLNEIAYELDYSSTAHLSSQFKKITGLTPSHFKKVATQKRTAIDKL
jgi:AraC-like DNA-binding protein